MVTIHISQEDLRKITTWNKNNAEKRVTTTGKFPYSEFRLLLHDDSIGDYGYDVSLVNNQVEVGSVTYFAKSERSTQLFFGYKMINDMVNNVSNTDAKDYKTHRAFVFGSFICIMAYLQHKMSKRKTIVIDSKKSVKSRGKSGKRVAKTKDKFLLDDFITYEHKGNTGITHTYTCESWGVRGHYRHYKSGKTVFVKEYTKGKNRTENNTDVYLRKVK